MVLSEAYSSVKAHACIDAAIAAHRAASCQCGAVVDLRSLSKPKEIMLIGDLHARLDLLSRMCDASDVGARLRRDELVIIFLGDAVHNEVHTAIASESDLARLCDMTPSVPMMQTIMDLKAAYPENVYYLLGNHDYPSRKFSKIGINQGELYKNELVRLYGDEYVKKYRAFLAGSPLVVIGEGFVANHGGPCDGTYSLEDLCVPNLAEDENNTLVEQLLWRRWKAPDSRLYYDEAMVESFLKDVIGEPHAHYFVGHTQRLLHYDEYRIAPFAARLMERHYMIFAAYDESGYVSFRSDDIGGTIQFENVLPVHE